MFTLGFFKKYIKVLFLWAIIFAIVICSLRVDVTAFGRESVFCDITVDFLHYGVDSSGSLDSTESINAALAECAENGGGTVYLPKGEYIVSGEITIPSFVTLKGEISSDSSYGTVIIANVPAEDNCEKGLINIGGSAGACGLAVYYPNQDIENVKPYPFTFYVSGNHDGYIQSSITECLLVNSYRGIGACVNADEVCELLTIENIKGTVLNTGIEAYNESDVGTMESICFGTEYWGGAPEKYACSDVLKLCEYTKANATGLVLGDLEWAQFYDITLSEMRTGIRFVKGHRVSFCGCFYDITITGCANGIVAEKDSLDTRWGITVADSLIAGAEAAITNSSSGRIILTGTSVGGSCVGEKIEINDTALSGVINKTQFTAPEKNGIITVNADNTGATDASAEIQKCLDKAKITGAAVYVPGGVYRLDGKLTVPSNVELRGSSYYCGTRSQAYNCNGTVLLSYYGYNEGDSPLITLEGDNSGIVGVRILYPENPPQNNKYRSTSAAVFGSGDGLYIRNVEITAASKGIELEGCGGFSVKKLLGYCYESIFTATGCEGGVISDCLANPNALTRIGFMKLGVAGYENWPDEENIYRQIINPISKKQTTYFTFDGCSDIYARNIFCYGLKRMIVLSRSSEIAFVNYGADNTASPVVNAENGSEFKGVNQMRHGGKDFNKDKSSTVKLINAIAV